MAESAMKGKINVNDPVVDLFNQLPPLPSPLPKKHKDFVHSQPIHKPIQRPEYRKFSVFTAGSIEMGNAVMWQEQMAQMLSDLPISVCNPRGREWNAAITPDAQYQEFRDQVDWELEALEQVDVIAFFFDVKTSSPVSLLELGLWAASDKVVVCCGKDYWRHGNVKITCERYDVPMVESFADLVPAVKNMLHAKGMQLDGNGDLIGPNVHVTKEKPKKKTQLEAEKAELQREIDSLRAELSAKSRI
ncbi:Nuc deoxyri tr2 domain containing protein [Pyrenophora tritici-repentis]|nr:Nuc deoxyri tr2 domain containing protein [Pyrenophora tritici-repentis]